MPITATRLEQRRRYLGSSDTPIVFGKSPWRNVLDLYYSKVEAIDMPTNDEMRVGNYVEPALINWAEDQLGRRFRRNVFRKRGFHGASCDALGQTDKREGLEAKCTHQSERWGAQGTDEVPDEVILQTQHQMYCADLDRVWVPCMKFGNFQMYLVNRDEEVIKLVVETGRKFWTNHVIPKIPPHGDPPSLEVQLHRHRTEGSLVTLDDEVAKLVARFQDAKKAAKLADAEQSRLRNVLINQLGDAEAGALPDGRMIVFKKESRTGIDSRRLRLERPEIFDEFSKTSDYRKLLLKGA